GSAQKHRTSFPAGSGSWFGPRTRRTDVRRRTATVSGGARGRSTTTENTDRQVFWLSAPDGRGPPSRGGRAPVALDWPRAWPVTAAAPRRIHTGFPLRRRTHETGSRTCRNGGR